MRCDRARRLLSDEIDRSLRPGKKPFLDAHLRTCPACRAYQDGLFRLQAGFGPAAEPSAEYWAGFEQRLEAKLAGPQKRGSAGGLPFLSGRRRIWAAAAAAALAGAMIWIALLRPRPDQTESWLLADDALAPLLREAEADPELERAVDREVLASIEEMMPAPDEDVAALPVADPLFWEGLSEDELLAIASELEKETRPGGPK